MIGSVPKFAGRRMGKILPQAGHMTRLPTLLASAMLLAAPSVQAAAGDDEAVARRLAFCGRLAETLSLEAGEPRVAERWNVASLRYVLPLLELVPDIDRRRAITEAAVKEVEDQGLALAGGSKRLLAKAVEGVRVALEECNALLRARETTGPEGSGAPTRR